MSRDETATRLLVQKVILTELAAADKRSRDDALSEWTRVGQREPGEIDGQQIGTVAYEKGSRYWTVEDDETFLRWVAANHPDEVALAVKGAFRDAILAACRRDGGLLDKATGEVAVPPGVVCREGAPKLVARPNRDAAGLVRRWLGAAAERLGLES